MVKVVVDLSVDAERLNRLSTLPNLSIEIAPGNKDEKRILPSQIVNDAEILLCTFPPQNLDEMLNLKLIQISSAGYQQLQGINLPQRNIRACNALGVFDVPIAEWTISMIVNLSRNLRTMIHNQESGRWERDSRYQVEVRGRTLGIWGYGGIGRETARLAKAMGLRVHVMTRRGVQIRENIYRVPDTGDPQGELPDQVFLLNERDEFLSSLDYLVLAIPLNRFNLEIIGYRELRQLSSKVFLLNPARGPLISEQALLKALEENWIAGAALDAHYCYPLPGDHPLWKFSNVIITPHISGSSESTHFLSRVWQIFAHNIECYLNGLPLLNELSREQLEI